MSSTAANRSESSTGGSRSGVLRRVLSVLAPLAVLSACATTPPHYPATTAQARVGKPLFNLEMRWSTPNGLREVPGGRIATWRFNQYNYAGCSVSVHTDRDDIIRKVTWTKGCGPLPGKVIQPAKPAAH
ncbi:MAG: hypothetical protein ACYCT1_17265 [Steroidobacteraceae bacterium]